MEEPTFKTQLLSSENRVKSSNSHIKKFKRISKHSPKEISSKIPAAKIKKIQFTSPDDDPSIGKFVRKSKSRDPRFDKFSGKFNQGLFEASYSFLDEYREQELKEIEEALQDNQYSEKNEKLRNLYLKKKQEIQRIKDQKRELKVKRELMKNEREKIKKGKKPFFFKKGMIKMLAMKEKISELKQTGQYQEYSRKKRKREISNEKSELFSLPSSRR